MRPETVPRWPFEVERREGRVSRILEKEQAGGIEAGDRIRAVGSRAVSGLSDLFHPVTHHKPGDIVPMTVERNGVTAEHRVTVVPESARTSTHPLLTAVLLITTWLSLLLGFFVVYRRPADRLAWLLLALLVGFVDTLSRREVLQYYHSAALAAALVISGRLVGSLWPVWMFWFGLDFPDPRSDRRILAWARWPLAVPLFLAAAVRALAGAGEALNLTLFAPVIALSAQVNRLWLWFTIVPIGLFFANLGYKAGLEHAPAARRKLKLLLWGAMVGLTPLFLLLIFALAFRHGDFTQFPPWIWMPPVAMLMLFPATLAYVIVVWRAMDVGVVLRQSLQYALATEGLGFLRMILILAAFLLALDFGTMSGMNAVNRWIAIGGVIVAVLLSRFGVKWLKGWTDRKFFRERVNAEHVLSDLGDDIRMVAEVEPLLKTVAGRVSESLHVNKVAVLLKNGGSFQTQYAEGYATPPPVRLPHDGAAVARIGRASDALRLYWDDPECWIHEELAASADYGQLRELGSQLLLPVRARSELLGIISLGPKRSEEPYSTSDLRLLQSVATQTAFALENSQLAAAVAREVSQRERFARELEIAKEVQEQLLPKKPPAVPGLDYAGICFPAQSIGGDYFDYFSGDGCLYFAVGDVAGKGIPAALLMASVQSSLRGLIHGGVRDLGEALKRLNRLIYPAIPRNRFATLFFGRYSPDSQRVEYACAGHNAPLLLRADGKPEWLGVRGLALGLTAQSGYATGQVTLGAGDVLAIYSDGITEAMNPRLEEFGEQGLAAALDAAHSLPAHAAITTVVETVRHHAAGAAQHDDMTLMILRVVKH